MNLVLFQWKKSYFGYCLCGGTLVSFLFVSFPTVLHSWFSAQIWADVLICAYFPSSVSQFGSGWVGLTRDFSQRRCPDRLELFYRERWICCLVFGSLAVCAAVACALIFLSVVRQCLARGRICHCGYFLRQLSCCVAARSTSAWWIPIVDQRSSWSSFSGFLFSCVGTVPRVDLPKLVSFSNSFMLWFGLFQMQPVVFLSYWIKKLVSHVFWASSICIFVVFSNLVLRANICSIIMWSWSS
jgi:hypothetical protein